MTIIAAGLVSPEFALHLNFHSTSALRMHIHPSAFWSKRSSGVQKVFYTNSSIEHLLTVQSDKDPVEQFVWSSFLSVLVILCHSHMKFWSSLVYQNVSRYYNDFYFSWFMESLQGQSLVWVVKDDIFQWITVRWICALCTKFYQLGYYL